MIALMKSYFGIKIKLFVVQNDLKLPDDGEKVPKPNGLVADSIPSCDKPFYLTKAPQHTCVNKIK